jgi:hypothetical protein
MAHLPLPWIMGYDVEPLRTLESKRSLLDRAARALAARLHARPGGPWGYLQPDGRSVALARSPREPGRVATSPRTRIPASK